MTLVCVLQARQVSGAPPLLNIPEDPEQWNSVKEKLVPGGVYQVQTRDGQRKYCLWNGSTLVPCKYLSALQYWNTLWWWAVFTVNFWKGQGKTKIDALKRENGKLNHSIDFCGLVSKNLCVQLVFCLFSLCVSLFYSTCSLLDWKFLMLQAFLPNFSWEISEKILTQKEQVCLNGLWKSRERFSRQKWEPCAISSGFPHIKKKNKNNKKNPWNFIIFPDI